MKERPIILTDTIGETVSIRRVKSTSWAIKQRVVQGDNAQNPTWLRIDNPGQKRKIEIVLFWADTEWPHFRYCGYQKIDGNYIPIRCQTAAHVKTTFHLEIPPGISFFGHFPWYFNEDGDRFLNDISDHQPRCQARVIGTTAQGREIRCLTVSNPEKSGKKQNVLILARIHATESSGSFAVEGAAKYLLNDPAAKQLLDRYVFHLFPIVNPDGAAAGLKLTRLIGPYTELNMETATMCSDDPTMKSLRAEIKSLKPAVFIDFHSWLQPTPGYFFFDKQVGASLFDALCDMDMPRQSNVQMTCLPCSNPDKTPRDYCFKNFNTTIAVAELPWNWNRLPSDMEKFGQAILQSAIRAHEKIAK